MFLYLFLVALVVSAETPTQQSFSSARSEPVEEYPRALQDTLQQVQGEREKTKNLSGESNDTLATETPPTNIPAQPTSIIITNSIHPSMLAYKHWTGTYNPDIFTIKINGTEIAQGAQHTLSATADPVEIRFDYSFVNGKRTGAHVISYELNENITQANITFSWNDEWKVMVDNGKPVKHEEIKI